MLQDLAVVLVVAVLLQAVMLSYGWLRDLSGEDG